MWPALTMSSAPPERTSASHDSFLELLRNVSVLRVVFLHLVLRPTLIYFPWVQWIYPGMPEIFFVAGTLAAVSIQRRTAQRVIPDRLRRVLIPFALYVPIALLVMAITDRRSDLPDATLSARNIRSFVFPLFTPVGSTTRVVLWSHLWFVTVFIWLILLTPVLVKLVQRIGSVTIGVPLTIFASCVAVDKLTDFRVPSEVLNTSQFGTFYVLGLIGGYAKLGRLTPGREGASRHWLSLAALFGCCGALVALVIEPITERRPAELYSSKSAYLFIGSAWLALALAFHERLSAWVKRHPLSWLRACTQRTFTLYLWGLPASAVGGSVAKRLLPNRWLAVPVYLFVSLVALSVAVLVVGWVEDLSARRKPRLIPPVRTQNLGTNGGAESS
jgi:peptidoglycan-N-acetylglucosamine deacetylase